MCTITNTDTQTHQAHDAQRTHLHTQHNTATGSNAPNLMEVVHKLPTTATTTNKATDVLRVGCDGWATRAHVLPLPLPLTHPAPTTIPTTQQTHTTTNKREQEATKTKIRRIQIVSILGNTEEDNRTMEEETNNIQKEDRSRSKKHEAGATGISMKQLLKALKINTAEVDEDTEKEERKSMT